MKSMSKSKRASIAFVACACILACMFFAAGRLYAADVYPTNDHGRTYGSAMNAAAVANQPDLIAAVATNGEEGYVYKDELETAKGAHPSTPEDAIEMTRMKQKRVELAFQEAFNSKVPASDSLSANEAETVVESIRNEGSASAIKALPLEVQNDLDVSSSSAPTSDPQQVTTIIEEALDQAVTETSTSIPVYAVDGTTVIGEFLVGGTY